MDLPEIEVEEDTWWFCTNCGLEYQSETGECPRCSPFEEEAELGYN